MDHVHHLFARMLLFVPACAQALLYTWSASSRHVVLLQGKANAGDPGLHPLHYMIL